MELCEMIKVMQHYENGGKVEYREKGSTKDWRKNNDPYWIWDTYDYRIREPEEEVTIETWLMQSTIDKEYRIIETSLVDTVVKFKKVKLIESYKIKLQEYKMELKEMIKVMQHYDNGGEVQVKLKNTNDNHWATVSSPSWDWVYREYRIKEEKQKVTIEKWLCRNSKQEEFVIYETSNVDKNRQLEKIKFIESYEVEL